MTNPAYGVIEEPGRGRDREGDEGHRRRRGERGADERDRVTRELRPRRHTDSVT